MRVTGSIEHQVVLRTIELITRGWCQGYPARDDTGKPCEVCSSRAKFFCLTGAIRRASDDLNVMNLSYPVSDMVRDHLWQDLYLWGGFTSFDQVPHVSLVEFNDSFRRTQTNVLLLLKRVAETFEYKKLRDSSGESQVSALFTSSGKAVSPSQAAVSIETMVGSSPCFFWRVVQWSRANESQP